MTSRIASSLAQKSKPEDRNHRNAVCLKFPPCCTNAQVYSAPQLRIIVHAKHCPLKKPSLIAMLNVPLNVVLLKSFPWHEDEENH
jgi:hypothetical protein